MSWLSDWRRRRHMTVEERLLDTFEHRGTKAFIIVPSAEAYPVRIPPGRRVGPAKGTDRG